jgi:hypothetical protein
MTKVILSALLKLKLEVGAGAEVGVLSSQREEVAPPIIVEAGAGQVTGGDASSRVEVGSSRVAADLRTMETIGSKMTECGAEMKEIVLEGGLGVGIEMIKIDIEVDIRIDEAIVGIGGDNKWK